MTNTNSNGIKNGTMVRLPDGTVGRAYRHMGDTYEVHQGRRTDIGWRREQLTPVKG